MRNVCSRSGPGGLRRCWGRDVGWRSARGKLAWVALGDGFAFDNELQPHEVKVPAFAIDSQVICWQEFLPFVSVAYARVA